MYPYFYPSYFNPTKMNPNVAKSTGMGNVGMGDAGMGPTGMGNAGMGPGQQDMDQLPPVPGTTSGSPVEPVTPTPITMHGAPADFQQEPGLPVTTDIEFTQAYLRTQIGKKVRVEFLIGTNMTTDRIGTLIGVGVSYILLRPAETDDILMADIYSIKFVTIYA